MWCDALTVCCRLCICPRAGTSRCRSSCAGSSSSLNWSACRRRGRTRRQMRLDKGEPTAQLIANAETACMRGRTRMQGHQCRTAYRVLLILCRSDPHCKNRAKIRSFLLVSPKIDWHKIRKVCKIHRHKIKRLLYMRRGRIRRQKQPDKGEATTVHLSPMNQQRLSK